MAAGRAECSSSTAKYGLCALPWAAACAVLALVLFVLFVRSGVMKAILMALLMVFSFSVVGCGDDETTVTVPEVEVPDVEVPDVEVPDKPDVEVPKKP
jgi:hypothetical protein